MGQANRNKGQTKKVIRDYYPMIAKRIKEVLLTSEYTMDRGTTQDRRSGLVLCVCSGANFEALRILAKEGILASSITVNPFNQKLSIMFSYARERKTGSSHPVLEP